MNKDELVNLFGENEFIDSTFQDYLTKDSGKGLSKEERKYLRAVFLNSSFGDTKNIALKNHSDILLRLSDIHFGRDAFLNDSMLAHISKKEFSDFNKVLVHKNSAGEIEELFFENIYKIFEFDLRKSGDSFPSEIVDKIKKVFEDETRNILKKYKFNKDSQFSKDSKLLEFTMFLFSKNNLDTSEHSLLDYLDDFHLRGEDDYAFKNIFESKKFYDYIFDRFKEKKIKVKKLVSENNNLLNGGNLKVSLIEKIYSEELYEMNELNFLAIISTVFEKEATLLKLDNLLDNVRPPRSFTYIIKNFDAVYKIYQEAEEERSIYIQDNIEEYIDSDKELPKRDFLTSDIEKFLELKKDLNTESHFKKLLQIVPIEVLWKYFLEHSYTEGERQTFNKILTKTGIIAIIDKINSPTMSEETIKTLIDVVNHDILKKIELEEVNDSSRKKMLEPYLVIKKVPSNSKKSKIKKIDKLKQKEDILDKLGNSSFDSLKVAREFNAEILVSITNQDLDTNDLINSYEEVLSQKMKQVKNSKNKQKIAVRLKTLRDKDI